MKKNKKVSASQRKYEKGQIFVKVMAGIIAFLMIAATAMTLIYALL